MNNKKDMLSKGFSVIELLVVTTIFATLSVVLILNFRSAPSNQVARIQTASVILSDIRRAQSMASSGSLFRGTIVCGYGIHYANNTSYILYAGVLGSSANCQSTNHNYQSGTDLVVETKSLINVNMEIRSAFLDVFFEPPDPKTYINNVFSLSTATTTISIQLKGQATCSPQLCTDITVYPSGQIDMSN